MKKHLLSFLFVTLGLAQAQQVAPAAGTVLKNQVTGDALLLNAPIHSESNVVNTVINSVCSVSVTAGTSNHPTILPGEVAVFPYTIRNVGNDVFTFPLSARSVGASTPQLSIYADSNGNGQFDSADTVVGSLELASGKSANVFLVMTTAQSDQGDVTASLYTQCPGTNQATTSLAPSRVTVGPPPELNLSKSFSVATLRPGDTTKVTVTLSNTGASGSRAVVVSDPLTSLVTQGLLYQRGSAQASAGTLEYSSDNINWSTTEPEAVEGVRVRLDSLAAAATTTLTFNMKADASAEDRNFINVASLQTAVGANNFQASATVRVQYNPAVAIGPNGNPLATGAADSQSVAFALSKQETCFDHTVKNTGDVVDTFSVTSTDASAVVRGAGGVALTQPFELASQASSNVQVCYTPTVSGQPLTSTVTVSGKRGTSDTTTDRIERIESQFPVLNKAVSKPGDPSWQAGGRVGKNEQLNYTLMVTNPYDTALHAVEVTDPLATHLEHVVTQPAATISNNVVSWTVDTLAPHETRTFAISATVSDQTADDEQISNSFTLSSKEVPQVPPSNTVSAYVWNNFPIIKKSVGAQEVTLGDLLPYTLTLQNISPNSAMTNITITDTPAKGLRYIPGSSQLDGKSFSDPTIASDNTMTWHVDHIDSNSQRLLTYNMRVTPEASGELVNSVIMEGFGASGKSRAVASSRAQALVKIKLLNFAPQADILGTVFVDNDGNGKLSTNDLPLSGARVILAGGRISQTDAKGRFHFGNVALGTQALRLDPASVPYQPAQSSPTTRTVYVSGLTAVNFALQPNAGMVGRSVTFQRSDLTITKVVSAVPGGYSVTLNVNSPKALTQFDLQDALPTGAMLVSGHNTVSGPLAAGINTFSYAYQFSGVPANLLQEPTLGNP